MGTPTRSAPRVSESRPNHDRDRRKRDPLVPWVTLSFAPNVNVFGGTSGHEGFMETPHGLRRVYQAPRCSRNAWQTHAGV